MNELQVFNNDEFGNIRVTIIDGKEMFVGKDVAKSLGYSNPRDAISRHCKGVVKHDSFKEGGHCVALITEGDMYRLITHSKLPSAEEFEKWVFDEVLPTIRKHGAYMTEDTIEKALTDPDFLIKLATQLKEEKEARRLAEEKLEQQKPLMDFVNTVTGSSDCIDMNEMAKLIQNEGIKLGRNKLFELLRENKILMSNNQPYQKYLDNGYFKVIETTKHTPYGDKVFCKTMVTGKGQVYIVQFVKNKISNEESKEN